MVNGNDIIEHIDKCDHCIELDELKEVIDTRIISNTANGIIKEEIDKLMEECYNNTGRD